MRYTVFKLFLFVAYILIPTGLFQLMLFYKVRSESLMNPIFDKKSDSLYCYFVGSSRIKYGIDENTIKSSVPNVAFCNMGINGLSFNYSVIVAEKLLVNKQNLIFIELSRMHPYRSWQCIDILSVKEIALGLKMYIKSMPMLTPKGIRKFLSDMEIFVFNFIHPHKRFNIIMNPALITSELKYGRTDVVYKGDNSSMLKETDLNVSKMQKHKKYYIDVINDLIKEGEKHQSRIVFLLPLTFSSDEERKFVLSVYNEIPQNYRMEYRSVFIKKINNPIFLSDINHLNYYGAQLYSNELVSEVQNQLFLLQ